MISISTLHTEPEMAFDRIEGYGPFEQFSGQLGSLQLQTELRRGSWSPAGQLELNRSWPLFPDMSPSGLMNMKVRIEDYSNGGEFEAVGAGPAVGPIGPITIQPQQKRLHDTQLISSALDDLPAAPTSGIASLFVPTPSDCWDSSDSSSFLRLSYKSPSSSSSFSSFPHISGSSSTSCPSPSLGSSIPLFTSLDSLSSLSSQETFTHTEQGGLQRLGLNIENNTHSLNSTLIPFWSHAVPEPEQDPFTQIILSSSSDMVPRPHRRATRPVSFASRKNGHQINMVPSPPPMIHRNDPEMMGELDFKPSIALVRNPSYYTPNEEPTFESNPDLSFGSWSEESHSPLGDGSRLYDTSFSSPGDTTNDPSVLVDPATGFRERPGRHFPHQHYYSHGPYAHQQSHSSVNQPSVAYNRYGPSPPAGWDVNGGSNSYYPPSFVERDEKGPMTGPHDSLSSGQNHHPFQNSYSAAPIPSSAFHRVEYGPEQTNRDLIIGHHSESYYSSYGGNYDYYSSPPVSHQDQASALEPRQFDPHQAYSASHGDYHVFPSHPESHHHHHHLRNPHPEHGHHGLFAQACLDEDNSHLDQSSPSDDEDRIHEVSDAQRSKNEFLIWARQRGMSYKEIRHAGQFTEAESTLRGRYRILTKDRNARVRKPIWLACDVNLLCQAVEHHMKLRPTQTPESINPSKVPWKKITEHIAAHGGSYQFGYATCKKKWVELMRKRTPMN